MELRVIAHIRTDFPEKFGIPRQSGLVPGTEGRIVFEPEYRNPAVIRGIEGFDYLWLLWQFEGTEKRNWAASVAPPRLGGREKMGVFATRSPFRPNPVGLSSVKLIRAEIGDEGPVLYVEGADLRNNTPIFDIKPYLAYTDSHPDARDGFAGEVMDYALQVDFPEELLEMFPEDKREAAVRILAQDPRSRYQENDPDHVYGAAFAGKDIHFRVSDDTVHVFEVTDYNKKRIAEKNLRKL